MYSYPVCFHKVGVQRGQPLPAFSSTFPGPAWLERYSIQVVVPPTNLSSPTRIAGAAEEIKSDN